MTGNICTIVSTSKGQLLVTVPKALAEAMGLQPGDKVRWEVAGKDKLIVRIARKETEKEDKE